MEKYEYQVGGKIYIQRPLVIGQARQLTELMRGMALPSRFDLPALLLALGERLPEFCAIVLIDPGVPLVEKNREVLRAALEFEMDLETGARVLEDFFACNPIASLLERIGNINGQGTGDSGQRTGDRGRGTGTTTP